MHAISILTSIILKTEEKIVANPCNQRLRTVYYTALIFNQRFYTCIQVPE